MKTIEILINGNLHLALAEQVGDQVWLSTKGWSYPVKNFGLHRPKTKSKSTLKNGDISAPMPGQILKVFVQNNQEVNEGDNLFVVEAMKMEHSLKAPYSGTVTNLKFKSGDSVTSSDIVLTIEKNESDKDAQ